MPKNWLQVIDEAVKKIENDEIDLGMKALHKVEEHGKDLPEVMLYLADVWYQLGHAQEATKILQHILDGRSHITREIVRECELMLAEIAIDQADYEKAQNYLYKLKEEGYEDVHLYLLLADLYSVQDLEEVALTYLELAHQNEPNNEEIKVALGDMYAKMGQMSKAVELFGTVTDQAYYTSLLKARTLAQAGEFEQAYQVYREALSYNADVPEVLFGCGMMAYHLGKLEEGKYYIETLLILDEEYVTAYSLLSDIYLALGKPLDAMETLKKYVALSGFDLEQLRRLVALLQQSGQYEEAKHYQTLLKQWDTEE